MSQSSCIRHPAKSDEHALWVFYICRADYTAICEASGEQPKVKQCAAILLNVFEQWANNKIDEKVQVDRYNEIADREGLPKRRFSDWIFESAESLSEVLQRHFSRGTVQRSLLWLVDEGYLWRRQNPENKFDKAYQYKLNIPLVQSKIDALLGCETPEPSTTTDYSSGSAIDPELQPIDPELQPIDRADQSEKSRVSGDKMAETRMVVDCSSGSTTDPADHNKNPFLINKNNKQKQKTLNTEQEYDRDRRSPNSKKNEPTFSEIENSPEVDQDTPVPCQEKEESIARAKKTGEDQSSAAAPRKVKSVRVPRKKRDLTIRNKINDLGWLQIDSRKQFEYARFIATRRMQLMLGKLCGFRFRKYKSGEEYVLTDPNEEWEPFEDVFSSEDFKIEPLRRLALDYGHITQDEFNDLLEAIFEASVEWADKQGKLAKSAIAERGFFEFHHSDLALLDQLRGVA